MGRTFGGVNACQNTLHKILREIIKNNEENNKGKHSVLRDKDA